MAGNSFLAVEKKKDGLFTIPDLGFFTWNTHDGSFHPGGLFASVGQMGAGFGISPTSPNPTDTTMKIPYTDLFVKYVSPQVGYRLGDGIKEMELEPDKVEAEPLLRKAAGKKNVGFKIKFKVGNPSLRRLFSGGVAGAVSRTAVAPLETIRTHLMVGSNGHSTSEVFECILKTEGWKGLFRGNLVNVIRVAPSKAIELFAFDTVKKVLTPSADEPARLPLPPSLIAGACAGVTSTLCTYPLELLKTRLTIQRDAYSNVVDCFLKIVQEEGPAELYRGLAPSIIGVIPYAATNYFAYDALRKAYKKTFKREDIGNVATLFIGSAAAAIASSTTFPLEVARKRMQVGAVGGRQVYKSMLHALLSILEIEGVGGLYKGLGPSCMKLVPAAGISFMCYEACKKILVDEEDDD